MSAQQPNQIPEQPPAGAQDETRPLPSVDGTYPASADPYAGGYPASAGSGGYPVASPAYPASAGSAAGAQFGYDPAGGQSLPGSVSGAGSVGYPPSAGSAAFSASAGYPSSAASAGYPPAGAQGFGPGGQQPAYAPQAAPKPAAEVPFKELFDFSFTQKATPKLLRTTYLLAAAAGVLQWLWNVISLLAAGQVVWGLLTLLFGWVFVVLFLAIVRLGLEFLGTAHQTAKDVEEIKAKLADDAGK